MSVKYGKLKKSLKQGGEREKRTHKPPSFVYRDADKQYAPKLGKLTVDPKRFSKRAEFLKSAKKGSLFFSAVVKSEFPNRKVKKKTKDVAPAYKVTIKFEDILFYDTPKKDTDSEIDLSNGVKKYYKSPSFSHKNIKLKCQCADFRHRFEHQLKSEGGLFGRPRSYTRTTPPPELGGRPYANETDKIGFCKHIYALQSYLIKYYHAKR